jgi:uncharacterized protein (DUF2147 family)
MKKIILLAFSLLTISTTVSAQAADDIIGIWQDGYESRKIQIFKRGDQYFGKLVWLKEPNEENGKPKLDVNNPDETLRARPILGLEILGDFNYRRRGTYVRGRIYDVKSGNTYNGTMNMLDKNRLNIRAYLGLSILGKTETWTRIQDHPAAVDNPKSK